MKTTSVAFVRLHLPRNTVTLVRLATAVSGLRGKVLIYDSGSGKQKHATALVELPASRVAALEKTMDCEALDSSGKRWTRKESAEGAPG